MWHHYDPVYLFLLQSLERPQFKDPFSILLTSIQATNTFRAPAFDAASTSLSSKTALHICYTRISVADGFFYGVVD